MGVRRYTAPFYNIIALLRNPNKMNKISIVPFSLLLLLFLLHLGTCYSSGRARSRFTIILLSIRLRESYNDACACVVGGGRKRFSYLLLLRQ